VKRVHDRDLAAERALIDQARTALGRDERRAAREVLEQHAQRFPQGQLGEEREFLWIQTLVLDGQNEAASERAKRFEQDFPKSLLAPAIRALIKRAE
jgi:outer membrane protein assembly factor BamD (BamD/ComL family)